MPDNKMEDNDQGKDTDNDQDKGLDLLGKLLTEKDDVVDKSFRGDKLLSKSDLRLEVAGNYTDKIEKDLDIEVETFSFKTMANYKYVVPNKYLTVNGLYDLRIRNAFTVLVTEQNLEVNGFVYEQLPGGTSAIIVGGCYAHVLAGIFGFRASAMIDSKGWGCYIETDAVVAEIVMGMGMRVFWTYNHVVGARISAAKIFVDDFRNKNENFGVFKDNRETTEESSTPGSFQKLES